MTEKHMNNGNLPNIPLLREAVAWVEWNAALPAGQRQWHQGEWVMERETAWDPVTDSYVPHTCGTSYCVAGYIGQKYEPLFAKKADAMIDGESRHVSNFAREKLQITVGQADRLFNGSNSAEDIRSIAQNIASEAGLRL